jgi:F-type H+-transporting ATPase subunit delta
MKRASPGAARRYARALLDVALQKADPVALRRELETVALSFEAHAELRGLLTHPALSSDKKQALAAAVFKGAVSELPQRLIALLAEANRLELLPAIARSYAALLNAHRNVAAAEVVSAVTLADDQRAAIEAALCKATGMGVELSARVDKTLLGGVLVKIAGRHFDGSVRSRLRALRERLTGTQGSL